MQIDLTRFKRNNKYVTKTQEGSLNIYDWNIRHAIEG